MSPNAVCLPLTRLCRYSDEIRRLIQQQAGHTDPGGAGSTDSDPADDLGDLGGNFTDLGLPDGAEDSVGSVGLGSVPHGGLSESYSKITSFPHRLQGIQVQGIWFRHWTEAGICQKTTS